MPDEPQPAAEPGDADDAALIEQLVAERAAELRGEVPEGEAAALREAWARTAARRPGADLGPARQAMADLERASRFAVPHVPASSRFPGGAAVHEAMGRSVERHLTDLVGQLDAYAQAVTGVLREVLAVLSDGPPHEHPDLAGQVDRLEARLAELRRERS